MDSDIICTKLHQVRRLKLNADDGRFQLFRNYHHHCIYAFFSNGYELRQINLMIVPNSYIQRGFSASKKKEFIPLHKSIPMPTSLRVSLIQNPGGSHSSTTPSSPEQLDLFIFKSLLLATTQVVMKDLVPPPGGDWAESLLNQAETLRSRFCHTPDRNDLDETISLVRKALDLPPPSHPIGHMHSIILGAPCAGDLRTLDVIRAI